MFVLMSRGAPNTNANNEVVHSEAQTLDSTPRIASDEVSSDPESDLPESSSVFAKVERRWIGASMLNMDSIFLGHTDSTYTENGPTLRVGTHLNPTDERLIWAFERSVEMERAFSHDGEIGRSAAGPKSTFASEAERPVSRRALMQEFLDESTGPVL